MNIKIQTLTPQYVDGAYKVEKHCLNESWSKDAIAALVVRENAVYLVATDNEVVCGIAGMYVVLDEGQITNVAVLPEYRRQGVGKMLFGHLLEEGKERGVKIFTLEVASQNNAAIKLYGGFGFVPVGKRKNFYKNDDAIILNRKI